MTVLFRILVLCIFLFIAERGLCQCTDPGSYPSTAIEICSLDPIHQPAMTHCDRGNLGNGHLCDTTMPLDRAVWYKFKCYQAGYLYLNIYPEDGEEDLDFAIFDITNNFPEEVFHHKELVIEFSWSRILGITGTALQGGLHNICKTNRSKRNMPYTPRPYLQLGHKYLLVVSNSSDTDDGYTLYWNPSPFVFTTAVIVNPLLPELKTAAGDCSGAQVHVVVNREMQCSTLAGNGSDFKVTDAAGNNFSPSSAYSRQCNFDLSFDSLTLFFNPPLPSGNYTLIAKNGTDGNTLIDNCGHLLPVGNSVNFTTGPTPLPAFASVEPLECKPNIIEIKFNHTIQCSSIDVLAGEVYLTGPANIPVYITEGDCNRYGITNSIKLFVFSPVLTGGDYTLHIRRGPDGNTFLDECGDEMPLNSTITFHIADTVDATFQYDIDYTCIKNTVVYSHDGAHDVNTWRWTFDTSPFQSTVQHPVVVYTDFQDKVTSLFVSNGTCKDSVTQTIFFANYMKAGFDISDDVCPDEKAVFVNTTISHSIISNWRWEPGNGTILSSQDPLPQAYVPAITNDYTAYPKLTITNSFGCSQSVTKKIVVHNTCFIAVPSVFTPNGDGLNDYLYPLKAFRSSDMTFNVYNRYGQLVFHGNNFLQKWDGKIKGIPQENGTYVWILRYTDTKTGKQVAKKGTTMLIR